MKKVLVTLVLVMTLGCLLYTSSFQILYEVLPHRLSVVVILADVQHWLIEVSIILNNHLNLYLKDYQL